MKDQELKDLKRVEELDDGLLEPEEERGITRGNSRRKERGGDDIRQVQLGERGQGSDDEDEEEDGQEGS